MILFHSTTISAIDFCFSLKISASAALFPALQLVLNLRQLTAVERRFLDAATLLLSVVVQQTEGIFAKNDDGYEVARCEECHEEIDDVPHQFEAGHSPENHHHTARENAIDSHYRRVGGDETNVGLAVIVVANDNYTRFCFVQNIFSSFKKQNG